MPETLPKHLVSLSKFLSLVLRHEPGTIGITLDAQGWVDITELLAKAAAAGKPIARSDFDSVLALNDKRRFTLSEDRMRIRAEQGHSIEIELALTPVAPPPSLYHGTATRFLDAILREGLKPQSRRHVHLSADITTAHNVGSRHGKPVVLSIDTAAAVAQGVLFFRADNGVWLTAGMPAALLTVVAEDDARCSAAPTSER
ncbi:MAG: RNA 2'-phosphotransferase [Rhodanobacteraceae bacterium]|nr:RNA 2'-phosphotransferase [Rhodanobacteraceae bacterium]